MVVVRSQLAGGPRWTQLAVVVVMAAVALVCGCATSQPQQEEKGQEQALLGHGQPLAAGRAKQVEPTPAQVELNRMAVEAVAQGKPEEAHELLRAALSLGELNVTWLNLGRLHATRGRCEDAASAYRRALQAPMVPLPAPSEVAATVASYRRQLFEEQCAGSVRVLCGDEPREVWLDGRTIGCGGDPLPVAWGTHELVWSAAAGEPETLTFEVGPGQALELRVGDAHETPTAP